MRTYADEVFAEYGQINILVNNAGVTVAMDFEHHTLEDWEWLIGVNLWGVVYGCKFFLPYLERAREAHIVNLSSVFGIIGFPGQSSYCAAKFAVRGLSEALWVELKDKNIGVTSVHPAGVRTNIARSARSTGGGLKQQGIDVLERVSITPDRCARLIVQAIRKNKMRQLVTRESYITDLLKRIAPTWPQHILYWSRARGLLKGHGDQA
jgi:NAD(P)-dependent dehydrogenase (short-subunit alcohol dehydrogenase family)